MTNVPIRLIGHPRAILEFAKGEFLIGFDDNSFSYVVLKRFIKE